MRGSMMPQIHSDVFVKIDAAIQTGALHRSGCMSYSACIMAMATAALVTVETEDSKDSNSKLNHDHTDVQHWSAVIGLSTFCEEPHCV